MSMKFSKWHGLGNDFIIVEVSKKDDGTLQKASVELCDRHFGIGADGLVTLQKLGTNEFEMHIYNSDGSEAEMCGNASRCVGLYIKKRNLATGSTYDLHTGAGLIQLNVLSDDLVRVDMGFPKLTRGQIPVLGEVSDSALDLDLVASGHALKGSAVSMGNPHVVIFVDDINNVPIEEWGPQIETAALFPNKTNVEFAQVLAPDLVRMRVWERGCGVTKACGTGCCATAVAGVLSNRTGNDVTILLDGGKLRIEYDPQVGKVFMTGPATEVFTGTTL